jgi:hypothetical protein
MAVRNAAAMARESVATRYAVVIDDVVPPEAAALYAELLGDADANVHLVTLLPRLDLNLRRDAARGADSIPDRVRVLHADFSRWAGEGKQPGVVIDSSDDADAAVTADRVQDAVASGDALLTTASSPAR